MLFSNFYGLLRVLVVGVLAYAALVITLRASGKRTLSKMNAFDLVVTVALGSSFATVLLSKQVALVEGVLAFALLAGLQYVLAWSLIRFGWVRRALKSQPALLFYRGEFHDDALRQERVTRGEIRAAVRTQGFASLDLVEAVVLETAGDLSIIAKREGSAVDALVDAAPGAHPPGKATAATLAR